ncbi:DUF5963 family protein [Lebetimonas sp. JH369]|uniref:DUF5963 family protein n=1 Tax=Lebetimonas sp. JH369 TaxID=990069 RepID=UPI00350FA4FD
MANLSSIIYALYIFGLKIWKIFKTGGEINGSIIQMFSFVFNFIIGFFCVLVNVIFLKL